MRVRLSMLPLAALAIGAVWCAAPAQADSTPSAIDADIVVVAGSASRVPAGDRPIIALLGERGDVTVVDDDDVDTTDFSSADLVVLSSSVVVGKVDGTLANLGVPLLTWEGVLFDDNALATSSGETSKLFNRIRIVDPSSPLAAGLTGQPVVTTAKHKLSFGQVPAGAHVVATAPDDLSRAVIYTYEPGDVRADGTPAPSCRVGLFPDYVGASKLNAAGRQLVGAAIDWALACGPSQVYVQIVALNDFHGNLLPPAGSSGRVGTIDAGGAEYLASHVNQLEALNPNTTVVSAGDLIGASPLLSALFHDEPTIEAMNEIGLDINAVGNHEFDEGAVELLRMQNGGCHPVDGCQDGTPFDGAEFQFLAANVVDDQSDTLFPAYEIKTYQGAKVAYIGMTLQGTPTIVSPSGVAGLSFLDEADTVNALIPELQAAGVDAVVVLVHEGGFPTTFDPYGCSGISGPIVDIVERLDAEVDLVVSGHTHQPYNCVIDGIPVTSAFSFGRIVTDIDLQVDRVTGQPVSIVINNKVVTRDVVKDPAITSLIGHYNALAAPIANRPIGEISADIRRTNDTSLEQPLGNLIADAQLAATASASTGEAVVAFMNPGGVRADLTYLGSAAGEGDGVVTYGESFTVQPFGNSLVTMTLTGAQIETMLEQQFCGTNAGASRVLLASAGFSYTWDQSEIGAATCGTKDAVPFDSISLNGVPLEAGTDYRVTVNIFLADGGDGFGILPSGTDRLGGAVDTDALEAYFVAAAGPLSPPATDRIDVQP